MSYDKIAYRNFCLCKRSTKGQGGRKVKKEIVNEVVKKGEEFDRLLFYAEQESWIFISNRLEDALKKQYPHCGYACSSPAGNIFQIKKDEKRWDLYVNSGSVWNQITLLNLADLEWNEQPDYLAIDPKLIVFLS